MDLQTIVSKNLVYSYDVAQDEELSSDRDLVRQIQTALNNTGANLVVDGLLGRLTREALNDFKEDHFLGHPNQLGASTAKKLIEYLDSRTGINYIFPPYKIEGRDLLVTFPKDHIQTALSGSDYEKAASSYGLEPALIRAVVEVESAGSGFLLKEKAPCRPKILFEPHIFYRYIPDGYKKAFPVNMISHFWNPRLYGGVYQQWTKLIKAMNLLKANDLDPSFALFSCSWGLGQAMGFNHRMVDGDEPFIKTGQSYELYGYNNIIEMVLEAHIDEYHQLVQMLNFIKNTGLINALRRKDWQQFAKGYNGPAFAKNRYDQKLAQSYRKWQNAA